MTTLKEIDVEAVVGDIATHIKNQFEGILARVSKDKLTLQENVNMILNLPIVKGLLEEKKALIKQLEILQEENKKLKLQIVESNIVEAATNEKQGIFLEVTEIPSDVSSVTQEEIQEHIKEEEKKQLVSLHNEMMNKYSFWSQKLESNPGYGQLESNQKEQQRSTFTLLQSDDSTVHTEDEDSEDNKTSEEDEDEDEDEDEEDDDEEDNDEEDDDEDEGDEDNDDEEDSAQQQQLNFLTEVKKLGAEKSENEAKSDAVVEPEEEEVDVEEIKLEGKKYYTTDKDNGIIYEYLEDGEIGEEIGRLEEGKLFLS